MTSLLRILLLLIPFLGACSRPPGDPLYQNMADHLVGSWRSSAWTGVLDETWTRGEDGWLQQRTFYYEGSDTSYRASSKIEQVGEDLILFSVIQNSNPKIFKAVTISKDSVAFENTDYESPIRVVYYFGPNDRFERTILGYDQDSLISFTFRFQRIP